MGTLLLAQLMSNVCSILSRDLITAQELCLMDSAIALCWIQTFNCVIKIRKLTNIESWCHVPGVENMADLL